MEEGDDHLRLTHPPYPAIRGVKEYHLGFYSVAVEHKEGGFGAARILSGDELSRDPKPLVEMWAREFEHELGHFRG